MHYIDALIFAVFVRHIDLYPAMDDDSDEPLFQKLLIPSDSYTYKGTALCMRLHRVVRYSSM